MTACTNEDVLAVPPMSLVRASRVKEEREIGRVREGELTYTAHVLLVHC